MPDGFYESSFWYTELVLLLISAALGCWLTGEYIEQHSTIRYSSDDQLSPSGIGKLLGCLLPVLAFFGFLGIFSTAVSWMFSRDGNREYAKSAAIWGPARILKDERPLVFEHFCSLHREMQESNTKIKEMQDTIKEMESAEGKDRATAEMERLKREYSVLEAKSKEIESKASAIYFARFLSNLGVSYDEQDIDKSLQELDDMLSTQ